MIRGILGRSTGLMRRRAVQEGLIETHHVALSSSAMRVSSTVAEEANAKARDEQCHPPAAQSADATTSSSSCTSVDGESSSTSLNEGQTASGRPVLMTPEESDRVETEKLRYLFSQEGPYIGSNMKDSAELQDSTNKRTRRAMVRVPHQEAEYRPNETSFRRLPRDLIIPTEHELRGLYPQATGLELQMGEAHCVDSSALGIDEEAAPISFSMLTPPGWSPDRTYPYMVVLADHRGCSNDFEDVCANFFERPRHRELMLEQEWVVVSPILNMKNNFQIPIEGIVARFCDWITSTFAVEHGRVHLFGKGLGAYCALSTCLEHRDVALSVVGILGRLGSPFRPMDRAQQKIKNFNGVHTLVYVPGLLRKQDYYYKFKFMMDMGRIRPPIRNIHFAEVADHQVYYAINPIEFWNHMKYFRQYNVKMLTDTATPR